MNKFELTISLVFGLLLWNWKDIVPGAALTNVGEDDNPIAQLDVTYVPEMSLSDASSWSAWQTNVNRSDTTESYIQHSSSAPSSASNSGASSSQGTSHSERGHAVSVTPVQNLWEGESWSDGITIEDPNAKLLPESNGISITNSSMEDNSEVSPNLLPNFWDPGTRRAPTEKPTLVSQLPSPQLSSSSQETVTVISVPVTVASSSSSSLTSTLNSLSQQDKSEVSQHFPWGFVVSSVIGVGGVLGVGYLLLKRNQQQSHAEL